MARRPRRGGFEVRRRLAVLWEIVHQTLYELARERAPLLAAALAYYALFSIAPLLLIAVAVAGLFVGTGQAQEEMIATVASLLSEDGVQAIRELFANIRDPGSGLLATLAAFLIVLFGASRFFAYLQTALAELWHFDAGVAGGDGGAGGGDGWRMIRAGIRGLVENRAVAFLMVFGAGVVLLLSLAASTALGAVSSWLFEELPGGNFLWQVGEFFVSFTLVALSFAAIYRLLAGGRLRWREAAIGGAGGALLFGLGRYVFAYYLSRLSVSSVYGAAGSLVVIMFWAHFSALMLFFGAQLAKVIAERHAT